MPPVLIDGALYFMLWHKTSILKILKYDSDSKCLSMLDASVVGVSSSTHTAAILAAMEDGSLGVAHQEGLTLNLDHNFVRTEPQLGLNVESSILKTFSLFKIPSKHLG
jgi:hypothetical protein